MSQSMLHQHKDYPKLRTLTHTHTHPNKSHTNHQNFVNALLVDDNFTCYEISIPGAT